jgi:coenzyme Q-binding protein COQ10
MPKYAERKQVAYQPRQMFDLVADVGKYPQFLPWCVGARIRSHRGDEMVADLTIGFGPFRESFTSRVMLEGPERIHVRYENGPFRYLRNEWRFMPEPQGTLIDFFVDFEFRSVILQKAIGPVFAEAVHRMVGAFLKRAHDMYGTPDPGADFAAPAEG